MTAKSRNWRERIRELPSERSEPPPRESVDRNPTKDDVRRARELVEKLGLRERRDSKR